MTKSIQIERGIKMKQVKSSILVSCILFSALALLLLSNRVESAHHREIRQLSKAEQIRLMEIYDRCLTDAENVLKESGKSYEYKNQLALIYFRFSVEHFKYRSLLFVK